MDQDKVNILLVDDQPAKLLAYEVILKELGENLVKAASGREALEILLKQDIALVLIDVCMPDLDGFELAAMIREHPRFQKTAIIFISAIHLTDVDQLRGFQMGAVYHSHVRSAPYPSQTDINFAASWPGVEWIIIGLGEGEPEVCSYLIVGSEVTEVPLEIVAAA